MVGGEGRLVVRVGGRRWQGGREVEVGGHTVGSSTRGESVAKMYIA